MKADSMATLAWRRSAHGGNRASSAANTAARQELIMNKLVTPGAWRVEHQPMRDRSARRDGDAAHGLPRPPSRRLSHQGLGQMADHARPSDGARINRTADGIADSLHRLTNREREVAELAARRATNRQIADELYVSVRTVEGHLLRAFVKLGVRTRAGLADALGLDLLAGDGTRSCCQSCGAALAAVDA